MVWDLDTTAGKVMVMTSIGAGLTLAVGYKEIINRAEEVKDNGLRAANLALVSETQSRRILLSTNPS